MKLVVVFLGILAVSYGSIIPPPPQDECASPTGGGLGAAVKDLVDLLPLIDMLTIYVKAVSIDPEVQQVVEYIESEKFHKIVSTMNNCQEYIDILEYFCEELHFHVYYYLNSAAEVLGLPKVTRPPSVHDDRRRRETRARPGFQGFLEDLRDVIPIDKLREVYKKRYEEDEYLRLAMEKIGSDEFRQIGDAIEALPEYQEMLTELRKLGVDVDAILEALMDFFNWHPR